MRYIYGQGVIVPFAQKHKRVLFLVVAALFVVTQASVLAGFAGAAPKDKEESEGKIAWCHTEPNGNQQNLNLPASALENAGHMDASGQPLHAGDHAGACVDEVEPVEVVPSAVTFTEPTCDLPGLYTVPGTANVTYEVNNSEVTAGNHNVSNGSSVTVVAIAGDGFFIADATTHSWTHQFSTPSDCGGDIDEVVPKEVQPAEVTFTDPTCDVPGFYTVPSTENVTYRVDGSEVTVANHPVSNGSSVTVVAIAGEGFFIGEQTTDSWSHEFSTPSGCEEDVPPPSGGQVLGDSTEKPDDPPAQPQQGHVLAATTLANTGESSYLTGVIVGVSLLLGCVLTAKLARGKR